MVNSTRVNSSLLALIFLNASLISNCAVALGAVENQLTRKTQYVQANHNLDLADSGFDQGFFLFNFDRKELADHITIGWQLLFAVLSVVFFFILVLAIFNNRLRKRVKEQTNHLQEANQFLVHQTNELIAAEGKLTKLNQDLEQRVADRTTQLNEVNEELKKEIMVRHGRELSLQLVSNALANTRSLVLIVDDKGIIVYLNLAMQKYIGCLDEQLVGSNLSVLGANIPFPLVDDEVFLEFSKAKEEMELCGFDASRTPHWFQIKISPILSKDELPTHFVIVCEDVTGMKKRHDEMERLAFYDVLTGLENRALFKLNLNKAIEKTKRGGVISALFFIDLDHFKMVNDQYGHDAGDFVLKTLATRIRNQVREVDSVARISGDEFAVLLVDIHGKEDAARVATSILDESLRPIEYRGIEHFVSASIGISLVPNDSTNADELVRNADMAMYRAKRAGRNGYHFYSSTVRDEALSRSAMEEGVRASLVNDELMLVYQAQIGLDSNEVAGAEALIRWNHPDGSVRAPGELLDIAEETGLVLPIGEWVLHEIEKARDKLQAAGFDKFKLSINLSPRQFKDGRLLQQFSDVLDKQTDGGVSLQLEIKERTIFDNIDASIKTLNRLKELGFSISVDDFGTGHFSISELKAFPVDTIKIDRSFIARLPNEGEAKAVATLIKMAHNLNMKVVAEGVETEEQLHFLKSSRCDLAQGYYLSEALSLDDFIAEKANISVH